MLMPLQRFVVGRLRAHSHACRREIQAWRAVRPRPGAGTFACAIQNKRMSRGTVTHLTLVAGWYRDIESFLAKFVPNPLEALVLLQGNWTCTSAVFRRSTQAIEKEPGGNVGKVRAHAKTTSTRFVDIENTPRSVG